MNGFDPIWNNALMLSGVPHGSVLGPLVFTMYTRPLGIIAQRYGVKYHLYADNTQLYIYMDPDNELNFSSSFRTLYCRYPAMDDSKSSKTK